MNAQQPLGAHPHPHHSAFGSTHSAGGTLVRYVPHCTHLDLAIFTDVCKRAEGICGLLLPSNARLVDGELQIFYSQIAQPLTAPASEAAAALIIQQVAGIVSQLHARGLVHGHLKRSNVMLFEGRIVLTDFGLSAMEAGGGWQRGGKGRAVVSPYALPPEVLQVDAEPACVLAETTDLWGLGFIAAETLAGGAGSLPHQRHVPGVALRLLREHTPLDVAVLFADCSKDLQDFLASCLNKDPSQRTPLSQMVLPALRPEVGENSDVPLSLMGIILPALEGAGAPEALVREMKRTVHSIDREWAHYLPCLVAEISEAAEMYIPAAVEGSTSVEGVRNYLIGKYTYKCAIAEGAQK